MSHSSSKPARPRRFSDLGRWEGVFGNLQARPYVASAIVLLCLAVLVGVGWAMTRQFQAGSHWRQAQVEMDRYDFLKAKEHLEFCLEVWPTSAETQFTMARACRRSGDYDVARKYLDKADKLGWVPGMIDLELLLLQTQKGELKTSEDILIRNLDARHPEQHLILESLVKGYLHTYRLSEAVHWLGVWIERFPDDWIPRLWRAQSYERVHNRGKAIEDYREVLKRKEDHGEARIHLADLLLKNYPEEALPHYEYYHQHHPDEAPALVGLARCYRGLGQIDKATATLDEFFARKSDGKNSGAFLIRAQLALDRGNPKEAMEWLKRAEAISPFEVDIVHTMALTHRQLGQNADADKYQAKQEELKKDQKELEAATEGLMGDPKNAALRCKAGTIMMKVGLAREGKRWLDSALQEDPQHADTHLALSDFYRKQADEADAELKKTPDAPPAQKKEAVDLRARADYHRRQGEKK